MKMIDLAYEIFNEMSSQEQNKYKEKCNCFICESKDDYYGLYPFCQHFSVCATNVILEELG